MKVLLYSEGQKSLKRSGIGRALYHQMKALETAGVEYTTNIHDNYDLVHINTVYPKSYRMLKKWQKKGYKVITHAHSTREDFLNSFRFYRIITPWWNECLEKMYSHGDMIITPTEYSKNLIESYEFETQEIRVISNGIDVSQYAYNEEAVLKFKNFFNIKENEKVVMSVGLFLKRKGIHDFFDVARKMPNVKFIWFGYLNPVLVSSFVNKEIANKPSNVIMPGYITGDIIKGAYSSADAFFFPSYEETEGIVVLEALASKCPIVVRDIGVYSGWLFDKVNCRMGHNNDEFKAILEEVMETDQNILTNNGYKIALEKSIENVGQQLKKAYEDVLKK